ncbi:MAG: hypothetical protein KDB88_07295 [Flavobacteriales bacterium]|nr:hypothetical protein [Flavobacteriales bacterium]
MSMEGERTKWMMLAGSIALLLVPGCRRDDPAPVDLGYGYFPTRVGSWVEYQVDSSWLDEAFQQSGNISYRLLERIDSSYIDLGGRRAERIERFVQDSLGNWIIRDIWTQTRNSVAAERTEEDRRFLKMIFPVRAGERWNLNAYNSQDDLEVGFGIADVPWSANGLSFDSTAVVQSYYPNNPIDTIIYWERYAKHVGLVERIVDSSETQLSGTRGWYFRQVVVDHGP